MATRGKKDALAEELAKLATLRSGPLCDADVAYLMKTVERGVSFAAARAAKLVTERALDGFGRVLHAAFDRFLVDGAKSDPGCEAKVALLEALDASSTTDPDPFLAGARLIQLEASWGKPVDTAPGVRSRAIRALANMGFRDIHLVAGELLADPSAPVRQAAAEALVHAGDRAGAGLLALAARRRDEDPVTETAYYWGLLALAADHYLPWLRELLFADDRDRCELVAIALGQSGREDAAALLMECMERSILAAERAVAIRALGLHRSDRALDAMLALIADGTEQDAAEAVRALAPRRFEPRARERIEGAVGKRACRAVTVAFDESFV